MDQKPLATLALGFLLGAALFVGTERNGGGELAPTAAALSPAAAPSSAPSLARAPLAPRDARPGETRTPLPRRSPLTIAGHAPTSAHWRAELAEWFGSSEFLDHLGTDPAQLGEVLFHISAARGDVARAEQLLAELPEAGSDEWLRVAEIYVQRGEPAHAADLYFEAFARDSWDDDLFAVAARLDPRRALPILQRETGLLGEDAYSTGQLLQLAHLLDRAGRRGEAHLVLERLAEMDAPDTEDLHLLANLDPDKVERLLRERMVSSGWCGTSAHLAWTAYLEFLAGQGRREDLITELLDTGWSLNDSQHERLVDLAPERWAARLRERVAAKPNDGEAWSWLGECHAALGDDDAAVSCWLRTASTAGPSASVMRAAELDPERTLRRVESLLEDEDSGWSAGEFGDLCWQANRPRRAALAWQRARLEDPGDSDWFNRLQRLDLGQDPLSDPEPSDVWDRLTELFD